MHPTLPSNTPDIRLFGTVNQAMLSEFLRQQAAAPTERPVVFELSTTGGDAEVGRRIAQELRLWRRSREDLFFFGKSYVYSAGVTIMAAFERQHRYLSADCELLIHERRMQKEVHLQASLSACLIQVRSVLAELESGQRLERDGFQQLVDGSELALADLEARVRDADWYMTAEQARQLGLVAGIVG